MRIDVELTDKQAARLLQALVGASYDGPVLASLSAQLDAQAEEQRSARTKKREAPKPASPPKTVKRRSEAPKVAAPPRTFGRWAARG